MHTGIAFAAVPKINAGITSSLGMGSLCAFAATVIGFGTFGWLGVAGTVTASVVSMSSIGITSSVRRTKLQKTRIDTVLRDVFHTDSVISIPQTSSLLSGGRVILRQSESEVIELNYLGASGDLTKKPGKEEPVTGMINIERTRDTLDGVRSFDSMLLNISKQEDDGVLNAEQREYVQTRLGKGAFMKRSEIEERKAKQKLNKYMQL